MGFLQHACASVFGTPLTNVNSSECRLDHDRSGSGPKQYSGCGHYWNTPGGERLQILWPMSQMSNNSPATAPAVAQTAQGPPHLTSPTAPTASTSAPSAGGIAKGTWAGIGIAAVIGIVALVLFAYFLWQRRRKASNVGSSNEGAPPSTELRMSLNRRKRKFILDPRAEFSPIERAELPPDRLSMKKAHEFPTRSQMSELDTDVVIDRKTMWLFPTSTISSRSPSQRQPPRCVENALSKKLSQRSGVLGKSDFLEHTVIV